MEGIKKKIGGLLWYERYEILKIETGEESRKILILGICPCT